MIDTVKPWVDRSFRTRPERSATGIFGSSLGGTIDLYAYFRYQRVFGFAGAMSHWMWIRDRLASEAVYDFLAHAESPPGLLYLDIGACEYVDPALTGYAVSPQQVIEELRRLRERLVAKGYRPGRELCYVEAADGIHAESAWAARLPAALRFLLSP